MYIDTEEEVWKEYKEEGLRSTFLISNLGRVKSIPRTSPDKAILLSGYKNMGYHAIPTRKVDGKNTLRYVHKLVAQLFVPNPENYDKLVFIDRKAGNCKASNLKWVSKEEYRKFRQEVSKSPYYFNPEHKSNAKLTPTKVRLIKKIVQDPNRKTRYKILAKQFGVSIKTLISIKNEKTWKEVKV
ncbi:MAG: NUMOD4 domain-containing protein [Bacteroidota bacterium]